MAKCLLLVSMLLCFSSSWGLGQQGGGDEARQDRGGATRSPERRRTIRNGRPMYLTGTVILDDGWKPREAVQIELLCQSEVIAQVYASSGGTFSIQANTTRAFRDAQQPMDASMSTVSSVPLNSTMDRNNSFFGQGLGPGRDESLNLSGCELQARLPGYHSDRILLGARRLLDSPDVGAIVLHSNTSSETAIVSVKSLAAPKNAKKAYQKALEELGKKDINFSKASQELEKAVQIYPDYANAWLLLGEISLELEDRAAARKSFEQALAADSEYANTYVSLAMLELEEERWEEAAQWCGQVLELYPQLVRAHYFNALAHSSLGNLGVVEESILLIHRSSQAQDYPLTHYMLAWILSQRGDFLSAAAQLRHYLEIDPIPQIAAELKDQLAQWEEQGLIPSAEIAEPQH
ncbi:MAG: tetratricopeptide repeat protein [Acidobacteria bacterium]|nr:tetratricopeptide repeat protein [Acidobacteriota bacterium]MCZ6878031.1 tetratricopeptide repeat protein [Acidobacteriota bacterium]